MAFGSLKSLTIVAAICLPTLADAQGGGQGGPPDLAKLASDLGITEDQARGCLPANPTPGQRPSESERAAMVNCFKAANPNLTDDDLRNAMAPPRR